MMITRAFSRAELEETLILPAVRPTRPDPEKVAREFLHHVDYASREKYVFVDVVRPLGGPLEMRVTCKHCGHTFGCRADTLQKMYYTLHIMSRLVNRIQFLPRFVKEHRQ